MEAKIMPDGSVKWLHNEHGNRRARSIIATDRNSYLAAVALHHSRVAQIAVDMMKLCRPETWNTEMLETMAAEIEKSHIEAFGVGIDPQSPEPDLLGRDPTEAIPHN